MALSKSSKPSTVPSAISHVSQLGACRGISAAVSASACEAMSTLDSELSTM